MRCARGATTCTMCTVRRTSTTGCTTTTKAIVCAASEAYSRLILSMCAAICPRLGAQGICDQSEYLHFVAAWHRHGRTLPGPAACPLARTGAGVLPTSSRKDYQMCGFSTRGAPSLAQSRASSFSPTTTTGILPARQDGRPRLVCVLNGTKAVIKLVRFTGHVPWRGRGKAKQRRSVFRHDGYSDWIVFPDGPVNLANLRCGTRLDIGVPAEEPKGMKPPVAISGRWTIPTRSPSATSRRKRTRRRKRRRRLRRSPKNT